MKEIEIGDLVRVVGKEWASSYEAIGIVTEVKDLVHKRFIILFTHSFKKYCF